MGVGGARGRQVWQRSSYASDNDGLTALKNAVRRGHPEVVRILLEDGADRTVLMIAREARDTGIVDLLIEHGAR